MEIFAINICTLKVMKGGLLLPLKTNLPIIAVVKKQSKVIIPKYIINGFPKIK